MSQESSRPRSRPSVSVQLARTRVRGSSAAPKRRRLFLAERATARTFPASEVRKLTSRSASPRGLVPRTYASSHLRSIAREHSKPPRQAERILEERLRKTSEPSTSTEVVTKGAVATAGSIPTLCRTTGTSEPIEAAIIIEQNSETPRRIASVESGWPDWDRGRRYRIAAATARSPP